MLLKIDLRLNWRYGLSSRVPALQVKNPKFEPQSYKKSRFKAINYFHLHLISVFLILV